MEASTSSSTPEPDDIPDVALPHAAARFAPMTGFR
jgi:hypothetical protein